MKKSLVILFVIIRFYLWSAIGFVVNSGSETLSRIDFDTGEVNNVFSVLGSMPNRVELTLYYAYVVNSGDNSVQKINLQTGSTETNIFIGMSTNPYDIILKNNFAYVSGGLSNKIYKIDLTTDEVTGQVTVGSNPAGMAIWNDKLYVGNTDYSNYYANCSITIIDLISFSIINTIYSETNPQFLEVVNQKIHISCGGDWGSTGGKICILDPDLEEIIETIELGGVTYNMAQTASNVVYVSDGFGYNLYAYDAENYNVIYNNANPFIPGGSMVTANSEHLFVLGGEWGQNFSVKKFDFNENLIDEYEVALYATDIKLIPEQTGITINQLPMSNYQLTNYPNPFNPSTTICFDVIESTDSASIEIYNLKGQKIRSFSNQQIGKSPNHQIYWDGKDEFGDSVASGMYFYGLILKGEIVRSNKMLLLK